MQGFDDKAATCLVSTSFIKCLVGTDIGNDSSPASEGWASSPVGKGMIKADDLSASERWARP